MTKQVPSSSFQAGGTLDFVHRTYPIVLVKPPRRVGGTCTLVPGRMVQLLTIGSTPGETTMSVLISINVAKEAELIVLQEYVSELGFQNQVLFEVYAKMGIDFWFLVDHGVPYGTVSLNEQISCF